MYWHISNCGKNDTWRTYRSFPGSWRRSCRWGKESEEADDNVLVNDKVTEDEALSLISVPLRAFAETFHVLLGERQFRNLAHIDVFDAGLRCLLYKERACI